MADLHYLEEVATRIKTNRTHLLKVDDDLSRVNARIHELPLRSNTESVFAKMIGAEYHDEREELEKARGKLTAQKETLSSAIKTDLATFIAEMTSSDLVIPLEPKPRFDDGNTIYTYHNGTKFSSVFEILGELLGLSTPIVVKDVLLSSSEIVIKVNDEFEAKKKFINSLTEVQKTLSIKKR